MILVPPLLDGAVKLTEASVLPPVAVPMVGALGATALTVKLREIMVAAFQALSPVWLASMEHRPDLRKLKAPPAPMVHTLGVLELKVTGNPEVAVADSVGVVPKL